jgi:hypothetical protein
MPDALAQIRERWRAVSLWCAWVSDNLEGHLAER